MNSLPYSKIRQEDAFTLSEMSVSIAIASIASILILTVGMTVIRGGLQMQRETEANYQLHSSTDKIVSFLKLSTLPPGESYGSGGQKSFQVFVSTFNGRIANTANQGTKMIQVDNFKKKGIRPNQKTINARKLDGVVTDSSQLFSTGISTNLVVNVGDIIQFDTQPIITRKVKSVNNPNAAVRTIIFDEALPQRVWEGTRIRIGRFSTVEFIGEEVRLYENSDYSNYQVLCAGLDHAVSGIKLEGGEAVITLETSIVTVSGQKRLRAQTRVKYNDEPLFSSEFMPATGGSLP